MLVLDARARAALGSLRCMLVGGEALPAPLAADLARLVGGDLLNVYGPTETTIWSATHLVVGDEASVPIGRPIANTTFYVLDEAGQPQPPGVPGELYIGGAGVARGYLNRPELTAERFVPNPFLAERTEGDPTPATVDDPRLYRTGDRVRYGRDGVVEFLGRLDSQVKLRGQRIELGEIEAALRRHPSVHEAVVVLRDDAMGGGTLAAFVTPANGPVDTRDVRSWIGTTLPDVMVPASLTVLPTLPRTPNGKLDRAALPSTATGSSPPQLADGPDGPVPSAFVAPQGSLESQIADVWRSVLGVDQIDVTASFFDLGGHSLLAAHLLYVLRERLGGNIALVDIFRFPTVRALARHLGTGPDDASVRAGRERAEARRDILSRRRSARPSLGR